MKYLAWVFFVMGTVSLGASVVSISMQVWLTQNALTISMLWNVPNMIGLMVNALFFRLWWRLM